MITKTKSILIAGSSWGCGEWGWPVDALAKDWVQYYNTIKGFSWPSIASFDEYSTLPLWVKQELKEKFNFTDLKNFNGSSDYQILHKGLETYFTDRGYSVLNISKSKLSNVEQIELLKSSNYRSNLVLWIQSDPLMDLRPYENFETKFTTYQQLLDEQNILINKTYSELNTLDQTIYCFGGSSKLNLDLIENYSNLIPLVPSIPEFLLPNFVHPEIWQSDWYTLVGRQFDIASIDKLLHNKKIQDSLETYKDLFWPDGNHPNRHGLKILFDFVIKELDL